MKLKRALSRAAAFSLLFAFVFCLSSCDFAEQLGETLVGYLEEQAANGQGGATGGTVTVDPAEPSQTGGTEPASAENKIPFIREPEVSSYTLPAETFADALEKEASDITDKAISRALGCVEVMKDDRHSSVSFSFDEDANGYLSELSAEEKELFSNIVGAAKKGETFKVTESEYKGDLKKAYFALYQPMSCCEPGIYSFCDTDVTSRLTVKGDDYESYYTSISSYFYDPYRDQNERVDKGAVALSDVLHGAELLDRVIKRIVRFMPEDISTYDKYYYLAAVLSELVTYDKRPDNCFTAFGALVCGRSVCEGYAAAYYLLCREADLWCAYRNGLPEGQGHVWNMVKLESGIYNVDVTWCDGADTPYQRDWYDCFMKTDEEFVNDGHAATTGVEGTGDRVPCPYEE